MALLRNIHTICPPEVFKFIMELFKYNDNSRNKVTYCPTPTQIKDIHKVMYLYQVIKVLKGQGLWSITLVKTL